MKWFSHESKANRDMKMKKLLMKYGAEGYGLYWYCLEHICDEVEPKLTFELEIDSEIIAHELSIDTLKVEEMMIFMVNLGLFEESGGVITCLNLAKHLGTNCTKNEDLRALIREAKRRNETTGVAEGLRRSEKVAAIREDKRREDKNMRGADAPRTRKKKFTKPSLAELCEYMMTRVPKHIAVRESQKFLDHFDSNGWKVGGKTAMKDWKAAARSWLSRISEFGGQGKTDGPEILKIDGVNVI